MASIGSNTPGGAGDSLRRNVRETAEVGHRKIDEAADSVRPAVDRAAERAHSMLDQAAGAASGTIDQADRVRRASGEWAESLTDSIRAKPWAAVGIAIAVGFVLGRVSAD